MNPGQGVRALFVCISAALLCTHAVASTRENRCGWLQNPTPANWWLDDKDGSARTPSRPRPCASRAIFLPKR
ncbi:DUF4087 domain-containing protein [Trinickia soli]|uniref:DUF4087 domain-containing protein n=1 Tax=Trinickia soli TaxID=380675 RepID=UPI003FA3D3F3